MASQLRLAPAPAQKKTGMGVGPQGTAIVNYLRGILGGVPAGLEPTSPKQQGQYATDYVSSHVDPYLDSISKRYAGQTEGGADAIRNATSIYSDAAKPTGDTVKAIGVQQASELGKESDALSKYLASKGASADAGVNEKVAAAGINPAATGVQGMGAGSAGETAAVGFAGKADATTAGMNSAELAALLPGLAKLTGQQAENSFRTQESAARDAELAGVTSQVPGLVSEIGTQLRTNEITKGQDRATNRQNAAGTIGDFLGGVLTRSATSRENARDRKAQIQIADMTGAYGLSKASLGYVKDPKTGNLVKPPSVAQMHTAVNQADTKIRGIFTSAYTAATKPAKGSSDVFAAPGGKTEAKGGSMYSDAYRRAFQQAYLAASDTLGAYMTPAEIAKFVESRATVSGFKNTAPPDLFSLGG